MFERFTRAAIEVVLAAREEAARVKLDHIGVEQMLLGVLAVGVSRDCAIALSSCGDVLEVARDEINKLLGTGSTHAAVEIPFSEEAKRVLEGSWEAANKYGNSSICEVHIFLAIIDFTNANVSQALRRLKIDVGGLEQNLIDSLPAPDRLKIVTAMTKEEQIDELRLKIQAWQNRYQMAWNQGSADLARIALEQKALIEERLKEVESGE
ncbi:MAG TPA: Clp protease N-terminal domain-containing protein [Drouetiella sp.]